MYSWDQAARASDEHAGTQPTETHAAHNGQARRASRNGQAHPAASNGQAQSAPPAPGQPSAATRHAQAVQFSLDRRDNGGDAGRTR
jgi:hypothetical protein